MGLVLTKGQPWTYLPSATEDWQQNKSNLSRVQVSRWSVPWARVSLHRFHRGPIPVGEPLAGGHSPDCDSSLSTTAAPDNRPKHHSELHNSSIYCIKAINVCKHRHRGVDSSRGGFVQTVANVWMYISVLVCMKCTCMSSSWQRWDSSSFSARSSVRSSRAFFSWTSGMK